MANLPDYFGSTYIINLPERVDRLKSVQNQLAQAGWEVGLGAVQIFSALRFADRAGFPNAGVRGCFQSHLQCLRQAYAEGKKSVLILEDDIELSPSLSRLSSTIISRLEAVPWDFVYFGHYNTGQIADAGLIANDSELRFEAWNDDVVGGHFYGVSNRILQRLIGTLDEIANGTEGDRARGPMPVDGAFNNFRRHNHDVRCIIVHPKLGWQGSSRSDITPRMIDRWSLLKPVGAAFRELKQFGK